MAITFATPDNTTSKGAAASGGITLTAPASPQIDDVWIAVIHSSDQVAHTFTDWTQIVQGNGGGTTSRLSVWYFRYAGATPNLTVGHTAGQSPIGGIASFRGVKNTGSPVNVAGSVLGGTDATIEHTAIVPSVAGCCLLVINGAADDNNRTALGGDYAIGFEDSAGGTQNCYQTALGNPDGSVCLFYDLSVPASTTGTVTVTQAAADAWGAVLVALEPGAVAAPVQVEIRGEASLQNVSSLIIGGAASLVFGSLTTTSDFNRIIASDTTIYGDGEIPNPDVSVTILVSVITEVIGEAGQDLILSRSILAVAETGGFGYIDVDATVSGLPAAAVPWYVILSENYVVQIF
jgi:hypothetical protein